MAKRISRPRVCDSESNCIQEDVNVMRRRTKNESWEKPDNASMKLVVVMLFVLFVPSIIAWDVMKRANELADRVGGDGVSVEWSLFQAKIVDRSNTLYTVHPFGIDDHSEGR